MENRLIEKQRFNQWWIWLLFGVISCVIAFGLYAQVVLHKSFGNKPMSDNGLIVFVVFWVIFIFFFLGINLKTTLTSTNLKVQFKPFIWKEKSFDFNDLNRIYIRTYAPIREYGGWGLRYSMSGNGKAYSISGKQGIQLVFKDGKKLLIGTQKAEAVEQFLNSIYLHYPHLKEIA